jgi:SAM-dependent methyltransferase
VDSAYDPIAEMYDRNWSGWYLPGAMPALRKLFFEVIPPGKRVLDVCCGPGHVTAELVARGYQVAGIDNSEQVIRRAKAQVPGCDFAVQDVRALGLRRVFDAALSTFDSLNHLLTEADLQTSLEAVRDVLRPGGLFLFDLNDEDAYRLDMSRWQTTMDSDSVSLVRGTYDAETKIGATELIWFERHGGELWRRQSSTVQERCYEVDAVLRLLAAAGFRRTAAVSAAEAGIKGDLQPGRTYFSAWV